MTLLRDTRTDLEAAAYLERVGLVFEVFDERTQDSGNVSYGVKVGERRFFVKTAGHESTECHLPHKDRIDLLRNAVELHESCRHQCLPRLHNVIASSEGPLLVFDWVDGDLLGGTKQHRLDPNSAHQRFRALPANLIGHALGSVFDLHRQLAARNWIAMDFYDGSLLYDFARRQITVIDVDCYRRGVFLNEMGRLFGSDRFMAPEECELGAAVDQRTTVFTLGRTISVFLSDGTKEKKPFRGHDDEFDLMVKACSLNPDDRYQSVDEFYQAWKDARRSLN